MLLLLHAARHRDALHPLRDARGLGLHANMVKVSALAAPELVSCGSSVCAWRLWAARHSQSKAQPLGSQPRPQVLELAASSGQFHCV